MNDHMRFRLKLKRNKVKLSELLFMLKDCPPETEIESQMIFENETETTSTYYLWFKFPQDEFTAKTKDNEYSRIPPNHQ